MVGLVGLVLVCTSSRFKLRSHKAVLSDNYEKFFFWAFSSKIFYWVWSHTGSEVKQVYLSYQLDGVHYLTVIQLLLKILIIGAQKALEMDHAVVIQVILVIQKLTILIFVHTKFMLYYPLAAYSNLLWVYEFSNFLLGVLVVLQMHSRQFHNNNINKYFHSHYPLCQSSYNSHFS